jgi:uncharacterized repeat protein (TIGR04076 family)
MARIHGSGARCGHHHGRESACSAGHAAGDTFEISCHNPAGLCGIFYHDIFPILPLSSSMVPCRGWKATRSNLHARTHQPGDHEADTVKTAGMSVNQLFTV